MNKKRAVLTGVCLVVIAVAGVFAMGPSKPPADTPERAADSMLRQLRAGDYTSAFGKLPASGVTAQTIEREKRYHLWWWWVVQKREAAGGIEIEYHVLRGWVPLPSPLYITLTRARGQWKVETFDAAY